MGALNAGQGVSTALGTHPWYGLKTKKFDATKESVKIAGPVWARPADPLLSMLAANRCQLTTDGMRSPRRAAYHRLGATPCAKAGVDS